MGGGLVPSIPRPALHNSLLLAASPQSTFSLAYRAMSILAWLAVPFVHGLYTGPPLTHSMLQETSFKKLVEGGFLRVPASCPKHGCVCLGGPYAAGCKAWKCAAEARKIRFQAMNHSKMQFTASVPKPKKGESRSTRDVCWRYLKRSLIAEPLNLRLCPQL